MRSPVAIVAFVVSAPLLAGQREFPLDPHDFRVLERDSGPHNYYRTVDDGQVGYIHGVYGPPLETVTLFLELPDELHRGVRRMHWRWRALAFPRNGNECLAGRGDSAATVYVTWKRGLRWYSLKFIWSTDAALGATCNVIRNPFVASDSVVLESGGPAGVWRDEEIDPDTLFRAHFEGGDPNAEVPELQGIGLLSDGDQTRSLSAADYAGFVLYK